MLDQDSNIKDQDSTIKRYRTSVNVVGMVCLMSLSNISLQDELSVLKGMEHAASIIEDDQPAEQMTSKTETNLLSMIERPLSQQTFSGLSCEDLRLSSSNATHPSRQPNGSIARPLSCSSDLPPSTFKEVSNFDQQTSNDS